MDASLQLRAEQLATEFASQARTAEDLNSLMRLMMKSALERMLNTELDVHLGRRSLPQPAIAERPLEDTAPAAKGLKRSPNRRNGKSEKTVQGDLGELTIATPRDRDGTFEPQLIPKHQRRVPGCRVWAAQRARRWTFPWRLRHGPGLACRGRRIRD